MLINELIERYGITRKPLYSRINALNIKLSKNLDNKSFATPEQVELLDQLHEHLKAGGNLKSFVPITDVELENSHDIPHDITAIIATQPTTLLSQDESKSHNGKEFSSTTHDTAQEIQHTTQHSQQELLAQIALLITEAKNPLGHLAALEQAIENEWLLTTAQVKNLIGTKPYCKKGNISYQRGSFIFTKSGKIGRETAWRINKK